MKRVGSKILSNFVAYFSVYSTTREVKIPSRFLACTYLFLIVFVWCAYIDRYGELIHSLQLDLRKMYQKECSAHGSIMTEVNGIVNTDDIPDSKFQVPNPEVYKHVWDENDLIFPTSGGDVSEGSFIAVTNVIITPNQTKGICPGSAKGTKTMCRLDKDCQKGKKNPSSSGVQTGNCSNVTGTCLLKTWCPVELNLLPLKGKEALLKDVDSFTFTIKNNVEFPECGEHIRRRNILDSVSDKYIKECTYDPIVNPTCPTFNLGDVVKLTGYNFSDVALTGAIIRILANWKCDFDWKPEPHDCFPTFEFDRLDDPKVNVAQGWSFRTAYYFEENRRTLVKFYGLKVLVQFSGIGRRFDLFFFVMTVGATMGLFCVAPLVCNLLYEILSVIKSIPPFSKCFEDFSAKAKYENPEELVLSPTPIQLISYHQRLSSKPDDLHNNKNISIHI